MLLAPHQALHLCDGERGVCGACRECGGCGLDVLGWALAGLEHVARGPSHAFKLQAFKLWAHWQLCPPRPLPLPITLPGLEIPHLSSHGTHPPPCSTEP